MNLEAETRSVPINNYGIIAPDVDGRLVQRLVGYGRSSFFIGIIDKPNRLGVLANLDRFTVQDRATDEIVDEIGEHLKELGATNPIIQTFNLQTNERRSYKLEGVDYIFSVQQDRKDFLDSLVLSMIHDGLYPKLPYPMEEPERIAHIASVTHDLGSSRFGILTVQNGLQGVTGDDIGFNTLRELADENSIDDELPFKRYFGPIYASYLPDSIDQGYDETGST